MALVRKIKAHPNTAFFGIVIIIFLQHLKQHLYIVPFQGVSQKFTIDAVRPQLGISFCPAGFFFCAYSLGLSLGLNCPPR